MKKSSRHPRITLKDLVPVEIYIKLRRMTDGKFALRIIRREIRNMFSDFEKEIRLMTNRFNQGLDSLSEPERKSEKPDKKEGLFTQIKRRLLK